MPRTLLIWLLTTIMFLGACSVEINQPSGDAAATTATNTANEDADESSGAATAVTESVPLSPEVLSGQIYYVNFVEQQPRLVSLDPASGEEVIVFEPPENAWLNEISLSPDGSQIVMTYAPPPEEGAIQFGFTDIYVMPADGSQAPRPILQRKEESEIFFNVTWPLDNILYYSHLLPGTDDTGNAILISQIERLPFPDGTPEVLVQEAAWPRLSADGLSLAYVTEINEFLIAQADGSQPVQLLNPDAFGAVDAPLFSPDGQLIYFSAVNAEPLAHLSLWDRLLGVRIAEAHDIPSDWWVMPTDGSKGPQRLTNLNAISMYGDFSPNEKHIAFITSDGVYVMNPDGSGLLQLRDTPTVGTLDWVP